MPIILCFALFATMHRDKKRDGFYIFYTIKIQGRKIVLNYEDKGRSHSGILVGFVLLIQLYWWLGLLSSVKAR